MKTCILISLLLFTTSSTLFAQPAKFAPFEGIIYDLDGYNLQTGYYPGIERAYQFGKVTLPTLNIPRTNQFARYFPGTHVRDMFGIVFTSQLTVSETRCYEFYLESDDGSILWIEDNLVIDNDKPHQMTVLRDTMQLKAGTYPVKVWYYNALPAAYGLILNVNAVHDSVDCSGIKNRFVLQDILFDFNSHDLLPAGKAELDNFSRLLKAMEIKKIRVVGHTDNTGTPEYNKTLSLRRAEAVMHYIRSKLNQDIIMVAEGKGYTAPVTRDMDPVAQRINRRVEVLVE